MAIQLKNMALGYEYNLEQVSPVFYTPWTVSWDMKCPSCGYDNPEGTMFCEECDWRMDQTPSKLKFGINSVYASYISLALGITAIVSAFIEVAWAAAIFGAIGTALAGYAQTAVRLSHVHGKLRTALVAIAGAGIVTSVVGMIYGMSMLF